MLGKVISIHFAVRNLNDRDFWTPSVLQEHIEESHSSVLQERIEESSTSFPLMYCSL